MVDRGNLRGIWIDSVPDNRIENNLISGHDNFNSELGIEISGIAARNNQVIRNLIGTDVKGNDTLLGNVGDDIACGGGGHDYLQGDENNDLLDGCEGNDRIWGGKDNDTIFGGAGDDFLSGDLEDDFLIGGSGNEHFLLWADSEMDIIRDFEPGKDAIALTRGLTSSQLSITQANSDTLIRLTVTGQVLVTLNHVFVAPTILD
jgi:Ca2+-binding RTX toxin-like protein